MENIVSFLEKDFLLNIDMLDCIRMGRGNILAQNDEGVLLEDKLSKVVMISSLSRESALELIEKIPSGAEMIVGHQNFYYDVLKEKYNCEDMFCCNQAVYTLAEPFEIEDNHIEIRELGKEYNKFIFDNYDVAEDCGMDYIINRLKSGTVYGAFIENEIAGFVGTHEEGSIGMLQVLRKFKRRGVGEILQKVATNRALMDGRYPYGQIKLGNTPSIELQKKLNFKISEGVVFWLYIIRDGEE